ncbi:MAG: DUF5808 domain-containing protein [Acidobacteriia bacterium]|nr:DUF5808 domain-containing protein [Terriglobia bacterium]
MRLVLCAVNVFMGALLFAIPNMARRELLFAVPVPPDLRESRAGRHAISMFRAVIAAAVLAGVCALLLTPPELLNAVATAVPVAILLAGGISFYRQNRKLAPAAVQFTRPREAELSAAPEELPRFAWLAAGPFVILAAAARFLYLNWERIPPRFPVHFETGGQPNRWAERTTKGVYGPLLFAAELCALFVAMALAGWFGSRRSRSRTVMLGGMIAIEYLMALLFALIAVQPLLGIPVWMIAVSPIAILIPLLIVMTKKMSEPSEPMDPTPNECWKGGIFYYNPNDAALFVEKREELGYTFNFANRWSWVLLLGLALVIASALFVLA